jgi:hypothetical protein
MSTQDQIKVMWRLVSDGTVLAHAHERLSVNLQAKYAYAFLPAVLTSEQLRQALADDGSAVPSPRRVASYACDLAQQLLNEFEQREWLVELPDPIPSEQEAALVRERLLGVK